VKVQKPVGRESFANAVVYQTTAMGQRVFDWPAPDGFPLLNESWVGVSRMLNSFQTHHLQAGGYYPSKEATHRSAVSWLPKLPARFDAVVEHVCQQLLARPATAELQKAASIRLQMSAGRAHRQPGRPARVQDHAPAQHPAQLPAAHDPVNG
jgi:hypothetical protein